MDVGISSFFVILGSYTDWLYIFLLWETGSWASDNLGGSCLDLLSFWLRLTSVFTLLLRWKPDSHYTNIWLWTGSLMLFFWNFFLRPSSSSIYLRCWSYPRQSISTFSAIYPYIDAFIIIITQITKYQLNFGLKLCSIPKPGVCDPPISLSGC